MIELQHLLSLCLCFDNIPFSCCGLWAWVGIKSDFIFEHTHRPGPKTASSRLHNSIWYICISIFTTGSNWHFTEKWVMRTTSFSLSLFANPSTFCNTTHCAMCTKLCLCGGGYGCTNSIWSEKKEDSAYLALGSSSFQIWKDLLIYSDILQKDWARLVCR